MEGPDAVGAILAQLEGFEAPASAWETEMLPARISEYEPAWLDEQCLAGRFVWTRLAPRRRATRERGAAPVRATPIVLLARRNVRAVVGSLRQRRRREQLCPRRAARGAVPRRPRRVVLRRDRRRRALLPTQVEDALAELVALGLVNSDSFAGLRALLVPRRARARPRCGGRRRRRLALFGMDAAGRWSRIAARRALPDEADAGAEHERERSSTSRARCCAAGASSSGGCSRARRTGCRRGASCSCAAGGSRRAARSAAVASSPASAASSSRSGGDRAAARGAPQAARRGQLLSLSGADPLNLVGILTPGARLPSLSGNRVLYRDGVPIALLAGGEVGFLTELAPPEQWEAQNLLLRRQVPPLLADLA